MAGKSKSEPGQRSIAAKIEELESRWLLSASVVRKLDPVGSSADNFIDANGTIFFVADDATHGQELWKSNGTSNGTLLAVDLAPGKDGSDPSPVAVLGNSVVFERGDSIWISDGTLKGTHKLWQPPAGFDANANLSITVFAHAIYFAVYAGSDSVQLWKSSGTPGGTRLLNTLFSSGFRLMTHGSHLFYESTIDSQTLLYSIDPSTGTPTQLGEITVNDDINGVRSEESVDVNGAVFFVDQQKNIWKTDGTQNGTREVLDLSDVSVEDISSLTSVGGKLYFVENLGSGDETLNSYDPTRKGSLVDLLSEGDSNQIENLAALQSSLLFTVTGTDGVSHLYRSDGTAKGTVAFTKAVTPEAATVMEGLNEEKEPLFTIIGNAAYFTGYDDNNGQELWKTDATTTGTTLVRDIYSGAGSSSPAHLTVYGDKLIFVAGDPDHGREPWISDGTASGTFLLRDINPTVLAGAGVIGGIFFNGHYLFTTTDESNGLELWVSDGTAASTHILKDIDPGPTSMVLGSAGQTSDSEPFPKMSEWKGKLYFIADGPGGSGLWSTDGTSQGTVEIKPLALQVGLVGAPPIVLFGDAIYFVDYSSPRQSVLYRSDGTARGTIGLTNPDKLIVESSNLIALGDRLYFLASPNGADRELWSTTENGRVMTLLKYIDPHDDDSNSDDDALQIAVAGKRLFFDIADSVSRGELWTSDGTAGGTRVVLDQSGFSISVSALTSALGMCFFIGKNDSRLYKSNGKGSGTKLVQDSKLHEGENAGEMTEFNGKLYYKADDANGHEQLWMTDGTDDGTFAVTNLNTSGGQSLQHFRVVDGALYFQVISDSNHSSILYVSDGTPGGTGPALLTPSGVIQYEFDVPVIHQGSVLFSATPADDFSPGLWLGTVALPASVHGFVFNDTNGDGLQQGNESGLSSWRVWLDLDGDGKLDANEPSARTNSAGRFQLNGIQPGKYILQITSVAGYRFTTPQTYRLTVSAGGSVSRYFGVKKII